MTECTASNGGTIRVEIGGRTTVTDNTRERLSAIAETISRTAYLNEAQASALREFFQHERDEELGRWRWTENPEYVVYRSSFDPSYLYVLNEETADVFGLNGIEGSNDESVDDDFAVFAAEAFRKAHPERKPWEDATYKDVWIWTTADNTQEALGWVAGDGTWDIITPKGDGIKAAERPVSALVEAGFEKFRGEVSGVKRVPEDAS